MMSREYKIFLDRLSQKGRNLNDFGRAYLTETIYIEKAYSGVSMMFLKTSKVLNINIEEFFTNLNMFTEFDHVELSIYNQIYSFWSEEVTKEKQYMTKEDFLYE